MTQKRDEPEHGEPEHGEPAPAGAVTAPGANAVLSDPWTAAGLLLLAPAAVALLASSAPSWSTARAAAWGFDLPFRHPWFALWSWAAAATVGAVYAVAWRRGLRPSIGMALMWVPVVRTAMDIVNDADALASSGQVLPAYSHYQLSGFYMYAILRNLGYLGVGFILWTGWHPRDGVRGLARQLARSGAAVTGRARRAAQNARAGTPRTPQDSVLGETRGMLLGLLLFPLFMAGALAVDWLVTRSPQLVNSDESSIWNNVTPWHAVMISAAAAVGEEAVYRLFLMTALAMALQRARLPARPAWLAALGLQAALFGFAHAGYANWAHVIQAGLFGLVAGVGALWLGVWVAIGLHFLVDIYAIGAHADQPFWIGFLLALLVANSVASLLVGGRWMWRRLQARRRRQA